MKRVLFVCLGNICRSPTAEAVFNALIKAKNLEDQFSSDSAGTAAYHVGEQADPRSREHGKKRGYVFESRARQFRARDFEDFDVILTMDDSNYFNVAKFDPEKKHQKKLRKMTSYCTKHEVTEVPDPYYKGSEGFEEVLDILEDACENLIAELSK